MTNAEAAAHFAAQPPDATAEIAIVNTDTCTMEIYDVSPMTENVLTEHVDDSLSDKERAHALTLLHGYQSW